MFWYRPKNPVEFSHNKRYVGQYGMVATEEHV